MRKQFHNLRARFVKEGREEESLNDHKKSEELFRQRYSIAIVYHRILFKSSNL